MTKMFQTHRMVLAALAQLLLAWLIPSYDIPAIPVLPCFAKPTSLHSKYLQVTSCGMIPQPLRQLPGSFPLPGFVLFCGSKHLQED